MSAVVVAGIPGPTIAVDQNDSCSLSLSVAPEKSFWRSQPPFYPEIKGDPREGLSRRRKAVILFVISQAGSLAGFSSTIYFPSLVQISEDLNASQTSINASVSLFILFMGVAPLITSTLSDTFKIRRILYLVYAVVFTVASFGGGYSNSAAPLILARIFQAVGSGGATILGAGTITDIYPPAEQGTSMGLFFLGQFLGPVLGPPIGGLLAHAFGWRSTFYFMAIVSVVVILELFFFLPETYRVEPEDLDSLETKGLPTRTKKGFVNPFKAVFLLRHPVIILSAIELGMVFGLMFSIETIVPELFTSRYGLNEFETGLTYLGAGVGSVIGAMMGGKLSDLSLVRGQRRNGGEAILEDRLSITMWIAAYIIVPLGALLFAWSAQDHLHIAVPIVGFSIYNFGMGQVMSAGSAYVVNAIPGQGSSATAAVGCLRMIFACIFSLTAQLIVDSIGYGNYGIIMAVINIVCTLVFHIVKFKGAKMRAAAAKIEQNKNS
ncbi:major facilitator superfamily domain-containing protein [Lobosporangium transversale]|uniref:Major facilitator superfamily domain-containing protein n=1 Tax=Lobosporangium transversale TaxID=64571 RepID=A0A1Y2GG89_9FUNG|nr:major facilitator superfamily domain-containing protein [Lobosporangium transversale]ORZ09998.1 major facilitator superfamily domain-containing protein [Lobosporangium transversale]|eukprot:XP_021879088.1 major facilitator superfamily domain-containing protein [Lobosporangium transversale]